MNIYSLFSFVNIFVKMFYMQIYWLALLTGLTTGGVSCFAVQGSLLTSVIASEKEINVAKKLRVKSLIFFLISKLVTYTLLGFALGFVGEKLIITPKIQSWFQILIGVYMLVTAANLIHLHPIFKHFVITPPKFIFRILKNQTKVKSFFTPILLGALTIFIPCGVTQGIMFLAVSAGSPITSALILFLFVLGTSPIFFLIGLAATELFKHKAFSVIAATIVAIFGIVSINSGQILRGSVHTLQNYWSVAFESSLVSGDLAPIVNGVQEVTITVNARGYETNVKKLVAGIPVRLTLITNSVIGCSRAFTIPDYNISRILPQTGKTILEFTPEKLGNLTYTCSMGMYSGQFTVIN
jgi:sulfite exporter TauE/SafE